MNTELDGHPVGHWIVRPIRTKLSSAHLNQWWVVVHEASQEPHYYYHSVGPWLKEEMQARQLAYVISKQMRKSGVSLHPFVRIPNGKPLMAAVEYEIESTMDTFWDDPYEGLDLSVLQSIKLESGGSVLLGFDQAMEVFDLLPQWFEAVAEGDIEGISESNLVEYAWTLQREGFIFNGWGTLSSRSLTLEENGFFRYTFSDGTGGLSTSYDCAQKALTTDISYEYRRNHDEAISVGANA